jgi:septum formation protein
LTAEEIEAYIASGQPFDKAGAYGIQGPAGAFVEGIEGDFFTVVGLPLCRLTMLLRELGG